MFTPKYHHTLCNANDFIYSIGGSNGSTSISDCEKYSISQNNWKALPALQTARYGCAAFTLNDAHIYCLCGFNNGNNLNSMEMMSVECGGKWEYVNVSNMFSNRCNVHGIQISNNEAIVFGGSNLSLIHI